MTRLRFLAVSCVLTAVGGVGFFGGGPSFQEVSRPVGIKQLCYDPNRIGGGAAFFDYNNDGFEDLYLTGCMEGDRLYENEGNGRFQDVTKRSGLGFLGKINTVGVATGDIDNDGDRDIYVTTADGFADVLLLNNGDGTFTNIAESAGITETAWSTAVTFGDYDLDGYLDIYVGNYATYDGLPYDENLTGGIGNKLYHNRGDNTFEEVSAAYDVTDANSLTLAAAFTDFDGDGDVDLYVGNDFGYLFEPNAFYRNEFPTAAFTDISKPSATDTAINAMGIAIGDYDEDNDLDYFVTNMMGNVLYENPGTEGKFKELGRAKHVDDQVLTSWGTVFLDYDNDTFLDLLVANGRVLLRYRMQSVDHVDRFMASHVNKLYRNDGHGNFLDVSDSEGVADSTRGRGLAVADYDNDGDLDFAVGVVSHEKKTSAHALLFRNDRPQTGYWLQVVLQGTKSNRDAFGARVRAFSSGRTWIREIDGGSSYLSQNSRVAHFGLGTLTGVDSLIVTWPGGTRETFPGQAANQRVTLIEGTSHQSADRPN